MKKIVLLVSLIIITNLSFSAGINSLLNTNIFNNRNFETPIADIDVNGKDVNVDVTKLRTIRPSFLQTVRSIRSLGSLQSIDSIGSTNFLNILINSI